MNVNLLLNLLNIPGQTSPLDLFKKYQLEIETLCRHVKWTDLVAGEILLTEELINREGHPIILEQLPEFINDLQIALVDDFIRVTLSCKLKGLAFNACYDTAIETFKFTADSHKLVLAIRNESVKAENGLINRMIMSIVNRLFIGLIRKTIINKAIEMLPGVTFDNDSEKVVIDLELLPQFQKHLKIEVMGKPLMTLVEIKFMGIDEKGIRFNLNLEPPIPSLKAVREVLGF